MFVNSEVLRYAASLIISALGFFLIRSIRAIDRISERVEEHEIAIAEIKVRCNMQHP